LRDCRITTSRSPRSCLYLCDAHYPGAFTKVLIYGAFQYFPRADSFGVLRTLNEGFPTVTRVFIGNVPDRARADHVFASAAPSAKELDDHEARIGVWYQPEEIAALASARSATSDASSETP
jgi:hypothetical protein